MTDYSRKNEQCPEHGWPRYCWECHIDRLQTALTTLRDKARTVLDNQPNCGVVHIATDYVFRVTDEALRETDEGSGE